MFVFRISQGTVVTHLKCGGKYDTCLVANLLLHPPIIYLSKTSKHINRANQFKNTYNIGLDAEVHVGLFNRLHVAHKNNTKIGVIYNHMIHTFKHVKH